MGALARVWLALAGVVAGVLCADVGAAPALSMGVAGLVLSFRRRGPWRAAGVVALAFASGALTAAVRAPDRTAVAVLAGSVPSCEVSGRTLEEAGGLGVLAAVDAADCGASGRVRDAGTVFLDDFEIAAGRRFAATGWLIPLGQEGFDLARRRAGAAASLRVTDGADRGPLGGMHGLGGRVRDGLATAVAPLGPPGALLRGLTIGDTSGIDPATEESLRRSGLAHLLAVSGSNVAILLGTVVVLLRRASLRTRLVCCAGALVLFLAVVGPDASVLRAAGMGAAALVALATGRRSEPLYALGLALVAVVAVRPGIVYSAGLHLSVAATLGIVLWAGPLAARLGRLPRAFAVALAATVAAQAAVAPLLVGIFGQLPVAGLPANLLALPAVAPATVLGLAAGAVAPWSEAAAALVARAASPFASWILRVGDGLGDPVWATLSLPRPWGWALALPAAVAAARALPRELVTAGP